MHKFCPCVGNVTCLVNECELVLPTMTEVAVKLKKLYEQSVYSVIISSSFTPGVIIPNRENNLLVLPDKRIICSHSPDYCLANSDYNIAGIEGRECTLNNSSSSQHCDNLCCDHGYYNITVRKNDICYCKFIYCCRVECDICNKTRIIQRCRGKPEESSTSYIDIYGI